MSFVFEEFFLYLWAMTEKKLITGLRNGDVAAYEEAFHTYYPRFVHFADYIVKDIALAKDIVQNVFLKVWRFRGRLDPDLSLGNYLYVLTKREVLNQLRSRKITGSLSEVTGTNDAGSQARRMDSQVDMSLLREEVELLPEQRRKVFVMSRFQGLPNKEIAQKLSISEKTVERHITLAGRQLRELFEESY